MSRKFYVYSLPGRPWDEWQPLEEHLKNVVKLAERFGEPLGAGIIK